MAKPKSSLQLFRDCLRLIKHIAGTDSPKAIKLRAEVASAFRANQYETSEDVIHKQKQAAERALSNYLLFERTKTDPKLSHMRKQAVDAVVGPDGFVYEREAFMQQFPHLVDEEGRVVQPSSEGRSEIDKSVFTEEKLAEYSSKMEEESKSPSPYASGPYAHPGARKPALKHTSAASKPNPASSAGEKVDSDDDEEEDDWESWDIHGAIAKGARSSEDDQASLAQAASKHNTE